MSSFGCTADSQDCADVFDPCGISRDEFICQALKLLPDGEFWGRRNCNFSNFFVAIASTYYDQFTKTCGLSLEGNPCTATDTLGEWASIWDSRCEGLPEDPDELRDLLCVLIRSNGVLTKQIIEDEITALGYDVVSCEVDTTRSSTLVTPVCGFIPGVYVPGVKAPSLGIIDECAESFRNTPCASDFIAACCDQEEETQAGPLNIQCAPITPASGFLKMGTPGAAQIGASYFPLENPWTINVIVSLNSPAIQPFLCEIQRSQYPGYPGFTPGPFCLPNFEIPFICAIEILRPAHLSINIRTECP